MSEFKNGNIKILRVENFQTFERMEFRFHPGLNFIAGPNGSGKSSIANAIALVFGGTPRTIGKASVVGEYVRFGACEGSVEVVVEADGRDVRLRRLMSRDNQSKYFVEGRQCRKTEYDQVVGGLGINVESLCQFLPQERICEFVKLSGERLLVEVLMAVGDREAVEGMKELDVLERKGTEVREKMEGDERQREEMKHVMEAMSRDVSRIEERERKETRVRLMKEKKKWMRYAAHVDEYVNGKEELRRTREKIRERRGEMESVEREIERMRKTGVSKELQEVCSDLGRYEGELCGIAGELRKTQHEGEMVEVDARSLESRREKRAADVEELRKEVARLCEELERTKSPEHLPPFDNSDIDALEERLSDLMRTRTRIQNECSSLRLQAEELGLRRRRFGEESERRMEMLKKYHLDTYRAVCWLRENRQMFKDEIIEPPYVQLGIRDQGFAVEVENFLGFQALSPFICKCGEDFEEFVRIMKDEKKWGINVVEALKADVCRDVGMKRVSREMLVELGFDGVVSDFIECRQEIMDYLIAVGHFDSIPVSKRYVDESVVISRMDVKRMAICGRYIEIKRSRYSSDYVVMDNLLKARNLFSQTVSQREVEEIEKKLEENDVGRREKGCELKRVLGECEEVECRLRDMYSRRNEHNAREMEAKRRETQIQVLRASIGGKEKEISRLEDTRCVEEEEEGLRERRECLKREWRSQCRELEDHLSSPGYFEKFHEATRLSREVLGIERAIESLESSRTLMKREVDEVENEFVARKREIGMMKRRMEEEKRELEKIERSEEYDVALEGLPNTIEELEEEIAREKAQLMFYSVDAETKRKFEMQEQDMDAINRMILSNQEELRGIEGKVSSLRTALAGRINGTVEEISRSFETLFRRVGHSGQVGFVSDGLGVSRWELRIMVRFRDGEDLSILNSYRQSGGEKSVSTMLFLLAVQRCRSCPFRLVDEINQGMDRHNEKTVHDVLVRLGEDGELGQFFIITPKIVPNLAYSRNMKVIILYSGHSPVSQENFIEYKNRVLAQ